MSDDLNLAAAFEAEETTVQPPRKPCESEGEASSLTNTTEHTTPPQRKALIMTNPRPDVRDETDHRDRIDYAGDRWMWRDSVKGDGHWTCAGADGWLTLSAIDHVWGLFRFADEVTA